MLLDRRRATRLARSSRLFR